MRGSSAMKLLTACGGLGLLMSKPVYCQVISEQRNIKKIVDYREGPDLGAEGVDCVAIADESLDLEARKVRYVEIEFFDYNDEPWVICNYVRVADEFGVDDGYRIEYPFSYNAAIEGSRPQDRRWQLDMYACAPYGTYELTCEVRSTNGVDDEGNPKDMREVSWEIEYGPDQYHIWDTENTPFKTTRTGSTAAEFPYAPIPPRYSGSGPGEIYKWPLPGSVGYYSKLYTGPLPPTHCPNLYPAGVSYVGCFPQGQPGWTDPTIEPEGSTNRLDNAEPYRMFDGLSTDPTDMGLDTPGVMTIEKCANFCSSSSPGYKYMGLQSAIQCICGDSIEGDPRDDEFCGIEQDLDLKEYKFLCSGDSGVLCGTDDVVSIYSLGGPAPQPTMPPSTMPPSPATPTAEPTIPPSTMPPSPSTPTAEPTMPPSTMPPSPDAPTAEPTMPMSTTTDYSPIGCAGDRSSNRLFTDGKLEQDTMSAEICFDYCMSLVDVDIKYFGTENKDECYCGTTLDIVGTNLDVSGCDKVCDGNAPEICGGRNRISVYKVGGVTEG